MIKKSFQSILKSILIFLLTISLLVCPPALVNPFALAVPPGTTPQEIDVKIQQAQAELSKVTAQLEQLNTQLEIKVEEYNARRTDLEETQKKLLETQVKYEMTQRELYKRQAILDRRVRLIYVEGKKRYLDVLLNTTNLFDFITRLRFLKEIASSDRQVVENLKYTREELERIRQELETLRERQEALQEQIAAQKTAIEIQIAERANFLKNLSAEIKKLLKEKEELERLALATLNQDVRRLLFDLGVTVEPGSIVETALHFIGIPYRWGGKRPETGFDCSGLVKYVFSLHGVELPHYSGYQAELGEPVERIEDLRAGDLVFFGNPIHHVGIYIDKGYFIHAPRTGDVVRLSRLSERADFTCARRVFAPPRSMPLPSLPSPPNNPPNN